MNSKWFRVFKVMAVVIVGLVLLGVPLVNEYTSRSKMTPGVPRVDLVLDCGSGVDMEFSLIPAGTFVMGSPLTEQGRGSDETQHQVTLSKPFYMVFIL